MEKAPGIYLEVTEALGKEIHGKFHSYLIYHKPDGTNEIIRGGLNPMGVKISVETRTSLEKSKDALKSGEKRKSQLLPVPPKKLKETWAKMRAKAEKIGKAGIDYRPDTNPNTLDQTSNSVVRAARPRDVCRSPSARHRQRRSPTYEPQVETRRPGRSPARTL